MPLTELFALGAMRKLDLKSLIVAGVAGAILLVILITQFDTDNQNRTNTKLYLILGFVLGAGVQVIERLTGAS